MTKNSPVHPGEILREEFMRPLELSSNALALAIGVTPARVDDIASENLVITADSACGSAAISAPRRNCG